jgi:hypothetical protein
VPTKFNLEIGFPGVSQLSEQNMFKRRRLNCRLRVRKRIISPPQPAEAGFVAVARGFSRRAARQRAKALGYFYEGRRRGLGKLFIYEP